MSCAYVCAACRKIFPNVFLLSSPRHYVARSSHTFASSQIHPETHPGQQGQQGQQGQRDQRPGIVGPPSSGVESGPQSAALLEPFHTAEEEVLQRMFEGTNNPNNTDSSINSDDSRRRNSRGTFSQPRNGRPLGLGHRGQTRPDRLAAEVFMGNKTPQTPKPVDQFSLFDPVEASSSGPEQSNAKEISFAKPMQSLRDRIPARASRPARQLQNNRSSPMQAILRNGFSSSFDVDTIKSGIGRAIEKQDVSHMNGLWQRIKALLDHNTSTNEGNMTELRSDLYAHILWGFMSVRRPNHAVLVWNSIINSNLKPTAAMWDTMLNGFGAARNLQAVNDIWNMMIELGFKPDKRLWVTRIRALATCGSWQSTLHAFEEMMVLWLRAVKTDTPKSQQPDLTNKGDTEDAPKPSVEALNGLVASLVQWRKQQQLMQVLSWAKIMGLHLDTYTFNPIIRMALKDGNVSLASQILDKMQDLGVRRDIATYTMILQSIFWRDHPAVTETRASGEANLSPDNSSTQQNLNDAYRILEEIQHSTLTANAYTYSTLISGLLKHEGASIEAAQAVVDYMEKKNIALSSQIYTSLIMAYFKQADGANVSGVVKVWQRARADRNVALDDIFYDRLVEGFAKCGELAKMKAALAQAGRGGKAPGWIALAEVIGALGRAEDWSGVRDILQDIQIEEQSLDRVRKGKGKKFFWDTIRAMGFEHVEVSKDEDETENTADVDVDVKELR